MMKNNLIVFLFSLLATAILAQDTIVKQHFKYQHLIIPTALITAGIILKSPSIQTDLQNNVRNAFGQDFRTRTDDYLQFLPTAQMLAGNYIGFKSEHSLKQMLSNAAISLVLVGGTAYIIKNATKDLRPDGSAFNSFPSGHTATAFSGATLQFLEYRESNIWYAASGYLFATATGVLRVANNRHWSGDVVTGAGLGMAIGTIVYYFNPIQLNKKTSKKTTFLPYPSLQDKTYGIGILCQF